MILLEDHLHHPPKRCNDCIGKHFLTIEALLEEAIALDVDGELADQILDLPEEVRELQREWLNDERTEHEIAQSIRVMRKELIGMCFDAAFTENRLLAAFAQALTEDRAEARLTVGDRVIVQSKASGSVRWRGLLSSADLYSGLLFVKDRFGHLRAVDLAEFTVGRHEG